MREYVGDMWTVLADARCVTTNGVLTKDGKAVMGAGCALEARNRYPGIDECLGRSIASRGNVVANLGLWVKDTIISFPVKNHWKEPASLELILQSAEQLVELLNGDPTLKDGVTVVLPRPGVGMGRLSWPEVRDTISPVLDDRILVITNKP